jgi:ERCC4-related helicase
VRWWAARDQKVEVILHDLRERNWLERNGAIIFSQYRTAERTLQALCAEFPNEPVALYAGGAASFVQRGTDRRSAAREQIKAAVQQGDIRLVCATDAACEGLNLNASARRSMSTYPGTLRGWNSEKDESKGLARSVTMSTS